MAEEALAPPTLHDLVLRSIKRTYDMFSGDSTVTTSSTFLPSQKVKIGLKVAAEYNVPKAPSQEEGEAKKKEGVTETGTILKKIEEQKEEAAYSAAIQAGAGGGQLVTYKDKSGALIAAPGQAGGMPPPGSTALSIRRAPPKVPIPEWHAPWKLSAVVAGHLGWVRAIAFDPSNEWFVTGSADRTIKVWDLAKCSAGVEGGLRLTLTGHISAVRALEVSKRFPYLFSCAEDKMVKCWDLEQNKVIRQYHGHLSGVYCLALHPTLDLLVTGGRDSVARVWDIRTKAPVHVLAGHGNTVNSVVTNSVDPQIISGSADNTIKLWDLAAGKTMMTLTNHKKAVRDLKIHPKEQSFVSAAQDNLKKWQVRDGRFVKNLTGHNAIINCLAINEDNVLISGGDNGSLHFWDYQTGYCFQKTDTIVQPGSLDCEAGIYASSFDMTGSRFLTCEADKTIKIWREDPEATEETYPVDMKAWTQECLAPKRY